MFLHSIQGSARPLSPIGLSARTLLGLEYRSSSDWNAATAEFGRFETVVFPEGHPRAFEDLYYVERIVKFLLWQRGGWKIYIGGPRFIGDYIRKVYSPDGERKFDYSLHG